MAQQIYLGPYYQGLVRFTTFTSSIPVGLQAVVSASADVQLLLVPLAYSALVQAAISQPGTPEHAAYTRLAGAEPQAASLQAATGGSAGTLIDQLNSSRQLKSDGTTVVNPADGVNTDGSINVRVLSSISSGKAAPVEVTLQNEALEAGNGTPYTPSANMTLTFVITGTSTSRVIVFEMADPVTGTFVAAMAFGVTDPTKMATQTAGGANAAPAGWQLELPAGWSFRTRISAISGGNVSVKGKAV